MSRPGEDGSDAPVLALVSDLMFASKIRGAGNATGVSTATVATADALLERCREARPRVILLDLEARSEDVPALIRRLKTDAALGSVPVVGFVSHVNREAIEAAREAGADRVLARSAFVRQLPGLIRGDGPDDGQPESTTRGG